MNIQKRIFKGAILSFVLCAVVLSLIAPCAFAATSTACMCEVLATINVRALPTVNSDIVTKYTAGTKFPGEESEYVAYADGYYWYWCPDGYIAQTGGLRFYYESIEYDSITGIDAYGQLVWEHECDGTDNSNWGYNISVYDTYYTVHCDCGWFKNCGVTLPYDSETGTFLLEFVGLDTDNDEIVDLRPGQTRKLKNRAGSDLRPYRILEFLDDPDKSCPTATLYFVDWSTKEYVSYTFNWSVTVHVESYGIVMVGNDGVKQIHYVDGDFLLFDRHIGAYLADTPHEYIANKTYGKQDCEPSPKSEHQEFYFWLSPPGEGKYGELEYVIDGIRDVFSDIGGFFKDFGGLGSVFTDEDSPIYKLTHSGFGEGVQNVFAMVRSFFSGLPEPLLAVIGSIFIITCLLGVFKLFRG